MTFAAGVLAGAILFSGPTEAVPDAGVPGGDSPPAAPAIVPEVASSTPLGIAAVDVLPEPPAASAPLEIPPELAARIEDLANARGRMEADLAALRARVATLEQQAVAAAAEVPDEPETPPATASREDEQRSALVRAGLAPDVAEEIVWRRSQLSLQRLELRDLASREGWLDTDRYREELRKLNDQRVPLREEIGTDTYDRYLFESGQDNRVLVTSVIPGSVGEDNGLMPGDVIETYAQQPVFDYLELREATSQGQRGELVPVVVRRGGSLVELWLPRGPIGIQLDSTRAEPQG